MSDQSEEWEDFAKSYKEMSPDERRLAAVELSPEQRSHLDALLLEDEPILVRFADFEPEQLAAPALLSKAKYESLNGTLARLNRWAREADIKIINIETIVLPNMPGGLGTEATSIYTHGELPATWHQFFRVWYRARRHSSGDVSPKEGDDHS